MNLIGLIVLIFGLLKAAELLFIPLLIGVFALKKKFSDMDEDKWHAYFRKMSGRGYVLRFAGVYLLALVLVSAFGYQLFGFFGYHNLWALTGILFAAGVISVLWKLRKYKQEFLDRVRNIR